MATRQRLSRVLAVVIFFTLFGGEAIRNTLSWYGYAVVALLLLATSTAILVGTRARRSDAALPARRRDLRVLLSDPVLPLAAFLAWCAASVAWSAYPLPTLLGVATIGAPTAAALAVHRILSPRLMLRSLVEALVAIIAVSFVFEALVAIVVGGPVLPVFPYEVTPGEDIPQAFYWSRGLLFEGGRIQGIVGNSNLLGFIALLAVITGAALLRSGRRVPSDRSRGLMAVLGGVAALVVTRSATVTAALVVVAVVIAAVTASRAARARGARRGTIAGAALLVSVSAAVVGVLAAPRVLTAMGRSSDLTGRLDIWRAVADLVVQRPVAGWGWTGYWQPWVPLFQDLAARKGVVYLQAHNAFLDVLFQLGVVGLVLFTALVVLAFARQRGSLLGIALMVALVVQAMAESRLLYEGNWALLVLLACGALLPGDREAEGGRPLAADQGESRRIRRF